uniref:Glycosyltransferase n=1 Tax=viral metagenome TaxID=1070528 RepID=A0A6C0ENF1_9ZZZZ
MIIKIILFLNVIVITFLYRYLNKYFKKKYTKDENIICKYNLHIKQALHKNVILKSPNIIPLNIYQTYETLNLPGVMKEAHTILKSQNPEFMVHLYDDTMRREFIKTNFNTDVLKAYDTLIPGAFRADLWRYCIIYIKGGIYLDIKFIIDSNTNLKLIDFVDKEYFVRDFPGPNREFMYNALMISKPKNKIYLKCIDQIIENTQNKYTKECLNITGPGVLATSIYNNIDICQNIDLKSLKLQGRRNIDTHIVYNNKKFLIKHKGRAYYKEIKKSNSNYSTLYKNKQVYN